MDIRSELKENIPEVSFRGHSDTETLIESIAFFGVEETIEKLNGMFAFAVWDQQEEKLYLIRDPFGIKPLYYILRGKELFFASEVKVLEGMGLICLLKRNLWIHY